MSDRPKVKAIVTRGDSTLPVPSPSRYESHPSWSGTGRHWEAGETNRLNEAHWTYAQERTINEWLTEQLATVRARTIYETRQNPTLSGIAQTLADDVVGPDGPTLQIQSSDEAFNTAGEALWRQWFAAPTVRPNVSGASLLRLWVRNLPRCGEFLARIVTEESLPGPVKMRLNPTHVRRLASPADMAGNARLVLGVEFDNADHERVVRYWIERTTDGYMAVSEPWPPDLVIHEFLVDEESQARGFPWFTPCLQSSADLRDYDDQVQDAARQMADSAAMLFCRNPEQVWAAPESTTVQRRTVKMVPPGWEPFQYQSNQPPVQYPDYRGEKQRDLGRPFSMPLMMVRLDSSKHNYSSARFDSQNWSRFCASIQKFLSGTDQGYGTLNRLADEVLKEGRFILPALRNRPADVTYVWTWPTRPHVDPQKEENATTIGLESRSLSLTDALAQRGKTLDSHIETLRVEREKFTAAGLPLPQWMQEQPAGTPRTQPQPKEPDEAEDEEEEAEANAK